MAVTRRLLCGIGAAVLAALAVCVWPSATGAQAQAPPQSSLYTAKIICGIQKAPQNLQLVRGRYLSAINLYNRNRTRVDVRATLALGHPPPELAPGDVFSLPDTALDAGEALAIDCGDLKAHVFPFGFPDTYIDGVVAIESTGPLSVSAVYTAAPLIKGKCCETECCEAKCCKDSVGPVASIDVEVIPATETAAAPDRPDLVPEPVEPESDPPGTPGTGFCTPSTASGLPNVAARIRNVGTAPAAASQAAVDFGAFGIVTAPVGPLGAGAEQLVTIPIPRGCFGTGSDGACDFDVIADNQGVVAESLESNNTRHGRCFRARQR